jgi:hypothetical protein
MEPAPLIGRHGRDSNANDVAAIRRTCPFRRAVDDRAADERLIELANVTSRQRARCLGVDEFAAAQCSVIAAHDLERERHAAGARARDQVDRAGTDGIDVRQLDDTHRGVICNERHFASPLGDQNALKAAIGNGHVAGEPN